MELVSARKRVERARHQRQITAAALVLRSDERVPETTMNGGGEKPRDEFIHANTNPNVRKQSSILVSVATACYNMVFWHYMYWVFFIAFFSILYQFICMVRQRCQFVRFSRESYGFSLFRLAYVRTRQSLRIYSKNKKTN